MTSATAKPSSLCLMGITCDEYETAEKTYTLSVNANNLAEALREMQAALNQAGSMSHSFPEDKLTGILIGQLKLTINDNLQNTRHKNSSRNLTNSRTEMRKSKVSQLANLMSSEEQTWRLPDAVHAVIAALFVLYDQDLVTMELRKAIGSAGS